jgi:YVTN family beta-propeller protein
MAAAVLAGPVLAAGGGYQVTDKQVIEGPVRWDYLSMDAQRHHLFLTRGDHVDVFDVVEKRVVGTITSTAGVHGVVAASDLGRGYTSNGATNNVTVFDLESFKPLATVAVGAKPDALVYDTATHRVFVANGKSNSLSVIDAQSNKVEAEIALGGAPETAVVDGEGRLFVALEDKNAVAEVDTRALKVLRRFNVAPVCDEPAGLAINPAAKLLYAGCHNQKLAVIDAQSGKLAGSAPIGRGNDAVAFDPERNLAFASNGDGSLSVVSGAAPFAVQASVSTMPRARTITIDPLTHKLYLVSAEMDPAAPKTLKPGSFTLLTVESR